MDARDPGYSPLSFSVHWERPWEEGPERKTPRERLRALTPALSHSTGRLVHQSEGSSGLGARFPLQNFIKAAFIYPSFVTPVLIPCQNNKTVTDPICKALSYLEKLYTPLTRPPLLLGGPWLLQLRPAAAPEGAGRAWFGRPGFLPSGSLLGAGPPVTDRGAVPHPAQGVCGPASCSRRLGDCNLSLTFRTACFKVNFQSKPRCSQHFVTKTNRAGGGG